MTWMENDQWLGFTVEPVYLFHIYGLLTRKITITCNNTYTLLFKSLGSLDMRNVLVFKRNSDFFCPLK
jgi:hypothetical protein